MMYSSLGGLIEQIGPSIDVLKVMHYETEAEMKADVNKGRLAGIILIRKNNVASANPYSLV